MNNFSVGKATELTGTTAKSLRHYDRIGLLKPLRNPETGYRYYGKRELIKLRQILFLKTLKKQRQYIEDKTLKYNNMMKILDKAVFDISNNKENNIMLTDKELYEAFNSDETEKI